MTLSCNNTFPKRTYGPGVYINEVTVADVQDISGTTLPFLERPVDIGIKLYLDIGREFQPELIIAGNFKRDPSTNEVIGWGGAFVVQEALSRLGYQGELEPNNSISDKVLLAIVGKRFLRLSYISGMREGGKPRYSDWNHIATVEEGPEDLLSRWKHSLSKGYPKKYCPDLLVQGTETPVTLQPIVHGDSF